MRTVCNALISSALPIRTPPLHHTTPSVLCAQRLTKRSSDMKYLHDTPESKAERAENPSSGACGICGRPWVYVRMHDISTGEGMGCFAQCEKCWQTADNKDIMECNSNLYDYWIEQGISPEEIGFTKKHLKLCVIHALNERHCNQLINRL